MKTTDRAVHTTSAHEKQPAGIVVLEHPQRAVRTDVRVANSVQLVAASRAMLQFPQASSAAKVETVVMLRPMLLRTQALRQIAQTSTARTLRSVGAQNYRRGVSP
jgi:hypothetical protein